MTTVFRHIFFPSLKQITDLKFRIFMNTMDNVLNRYGVFDKKNLKQLSNLKKLSLEGLDSKF